MNLEKAPAAGQGGAQPVFAPPVEFGAPAPQSRDEIKRQSAVDTLAEMLAASMEMLARCQGQANASRGDRLGPVYAAAQLLHANANIARALAHVGCVETRHRSIVERVQPPESQKPEFNCTPPQRGDEAMVELRRRIDRLIEAKEAEQEEMEGLAIGCCI